MNPCDILSHVETIDTYVIKPIKPHIDRALRKRRYREALENKVGHLARKQQWLKGLVTDARRETREIDPQVDLWQTKVETRIAKDGLILEEYERLAQQRCFIGLCPNFRTRYLLNYKAEAEVTAVEGLLEEAAGYDALDNISRLPPPIAERPIVVRDYESFRSREIIVQQVIDDLTVSGKSKLGVYGMGGSGKTTLVKVVAGKVMEKKSFDFVVLCKVTAVQNIANIQKEIMEKLGLKITEETPDARATRLLQEIEKMLKEKKKILFVLDDLWKKLKLEAVGIPSPDQHKGCQILMTSRQRQVLSTEMSCDNNVINIGLLSNDEAWELFKKMSGNNFEKHDALRSKAYEVAQACARLPIAIVTVARALKNNTNLPDWHTALLDLQSPSPSNFSKVRADDPAIEEDVHKSIYLSYKLLASDELRSTLLLCSQLLNNSSIRDLLRYSWSLRLLPENRVRNVEEAQSMLRSLVGQLQASCLLLDTGSNERIALHDVVRVITQAIASEEQHVFTRRPEDDELTDLPEDKKCTRMWLRCKIAKLPEKLGYRELELFHMDNVSRDLKVPEGIFKLKGRQRLKVLSLTNITFQPSLPSSLQSLKENLRTLCLDGSSFEDTAIVIIGLLENLEILSFAKCKIRRLPEEIGKLKKLKIFDLSDCYGLVVPRDVIGRLHSLEELYMGNSFSDWENERGAEASLAEGKEGGAKASLAEVRKLHLSNLEIVIPNGGLMVENLFSERLKRYRVTIGTDEWWDKWWDKSYETLSKLLRISIDTSIRFDLYGIQMLLSRAEVLCLGRMKGVKDVLSEGFPQLKHLKLVSNFETQYVVDAAKSDPSKAFPALESLLLENLGSLEEICHGEFRSQPFPSLAAIQVRGCRNLKNLFSFSIAQGLSQLKSIDVGACGSLEGIVGEEDEATDNKIEFSELRSMVLSFVWQLKKFRYKMQEAPISSGETSLKQSSLFDETTLFPKLEELQLRLISMKTLWHGPFEAVKSSIQNLRSLSIEDCNILEYLFTSSMVGCLAQLEYLSVERCAKIEEIIQTEEAFKGEEGRINENVIVFSKLDALYLRGLPKLKRFCTASLLECPRLTNIKLWECHALKTFVFNSCFENKTFVFNAKHDEEGSEETRHENNQPLFDEKVSFPSLAEMEIDGMDNLEKIWHDQLYDGSFCALRKMEIQNCKRLFNVFTSGSCSNFKKLEEMSVTKCHALEEIFDLHGLRVEGRSDVVKFQLRDIYLDDLRKLRHIWNKDPKGILSFRNLLSLKASECPALKNIFPSSIATDLMQLKDLNIEDCAALEEIVAKEQNLRGIPCFKFSKLSSLTLMELPKLKNFYPGMHTSEWPVLKDLEVADCGAMRLFTKSSILEQVHGDDHPENKIPQSAIWRKRDIQLGKGMPHLKELTVPLEVWCRESFINLEPSPASFQNLTTLEVDSCNGMLSVMSTAAAKSLVHLKELSVRRCERVSEIVSLHDGETKNDDIAFSQLVSLELDGLKNLTSFCSGNSNFMFPSLEKVTVRGCPRLSIFSPGHSHAMKLKGVQWGVDDEKDIVELKGDLNNTMQHLFKEMMGYRVVKELKLAEFPELRGIWNSQLRVEVFRNLSSLVVDECQSFAIAIPSKLLPFLNDLTQLDVRNCSSLRGIFDLENLKDDESHVLLPESSQMSLSDPPRLSHICNKDPQGTQQFENLSVLKVDNCSSLKSMAMGLQKLEKLEIRNCRSIEEIISTAETGEEASIGNVRFPNLKTIILESLPNLTGIYSGSHILEFPSLKGITIANCPKMNAFLSSILTEQEPETSEEEKGKGDIDLPSSASLLNNKVDFPCLEMLGVDCNNPICMEGGLATPQFSDKIKVIEFMHSSNDRFVFPSQFLRRLPNLGTVIVRDAFVKEIFPQEETTCDSEEKHTEVLALKRLKLSNLPNLKHLSNDESQPWLLFQNLGRLTVLECGRLKILASSSVSFQSLTMLVVSKCHGLIHLLTSSTAKSLVQLRIMWISKCKMIQEIVANEENQAGGEFNFCRLECLALYDLPNLTSFCSGKNAFTFPHLKEVLVQGCPQMKTFSLGVVNTPKLKRVDFVAVEDEEEVEDENLANAFEEVEEEEEEDEEVEEEEEDEEVEEEEEEEEDGDSYEEGYNWCWKGSLNATLGEMYNKMGQSKRSDSPREPLLDSGTSQAENQSTFGLPEVIGSDDMSVAKRTEVEAESTANLTIGEQDTTRVASRYLDSDATSEDDGVTEGSDSESDNVPLVRNSRASTQSVTSFFPDLHKEEATTPETQIGPSSTAHQLALGETEQLGHYEPAVRSASATESFFTQDSSVCDEATADLPAEASLTTEPQSRGEEGAQPTQLIDSQAVEATQHSADVEVSSNGQEVAQDNLTISSRQLNSDLDASQDQSGPREKLPFSSNRPTSNIENAKGEGDMPLVASQEEALKDSCAAESPGFNRDLRQEIETTKVIIEEQARKDTLNTPETVQNVSTDIFSSAILNDKDPTPGQISSTVENQEPNGSVLVQKDPQATADNEPLKHQAIASTVSARITAEQAPMSISEPPSKTTSPGELTGPVYHPTSEASSVSVEKMLSSPTDFEFLFSSIEKLLHSSPASTFHSALAKSNNSSADARFDSSSGSVDMLKKILSETTAEVDDGLLSRPTLEILKQQIERTVIELSIEDGRKEIAKLKSLYEGSTAKITTLDADEEELEKRLKEIREEKYQVQANIQDLYGKLVERKGELEQSMDALREAARQE